MKTFILFFKEALWVILEPLLKLLSCFLFLKTHTDTETHTLICDVYLQSQYDLAITMKNSIAQVQWEPK